jgi:hypothetical protein
MVPRQDSHHVSHSRVSTALGIYRVAAERLAGQLHVKALAGLLPQAQREAAGVLAVITQTRGMALLFRKSDVVIDELAK